MTPFPQTVPAAGTPLASPFAFELAEVSKRFGRRWALARLSFQLGASRSLLLTGHNGSGKTTLLRVLATVTTATVGTVRVLGLDARLDRDELRQRVALVSHASFLYEDLTAEQNLLLLCRLLGVSSPRDRVSQMLTQVGLGQRTSSPVRQFSAGMRKRLSIARLLLKRPALALLDEPFGELDPAGMAQMERVIRELQAAGTTIVLATHHIDQGLSLCEARLHLEEGRVATP